MPDILEGLSYSGRIVVTPTLTVHAGYVANDYVGTSGVPMTFAGAARAYISGGSGEVVSAILFDKDGDNVAGELWLFNTAVTPPADSAAFAISDADALSIIGVIPFTTFHANANSSISMGEMDRPIPFKCATGSIDIYGCFVTKGAPPYASGDVTFILLTNQNTGA